MAEQEDPKEVRPGQEDRLEPPHLTRRQVPIHRHLRHRRQRLHMVPSIEIYNFRRGHKRFDVDFHVARFRIAFVVLNFEQLPRRRKDILTTCFMVLTPSDRPPQE
jgi:hypothetical protein